MDFHSKTNRDVETGNSNLRSVDAWQKYRNATLDQVGFLLGDQPPGVTDPGPGTIEGNPRGEEKFGSVIDRPGSTSFMGRRAISPYAGFGDYLFGYLYYPRERVEPNEELPVVIYLHEYDYSKGFSSMSLNHAIHRYIQDLVRAGFAVFAFDMIGFGTRQQEGLHFYRRYPRWSKMGKMVEDVRGAVDALSNMEGIDPEKIFVTGYSLGATVGLYATAMDERIAGVASVSGFTPMREGIHGALHVDDLSRQHLLIPRLGFFQDHPDRIPFDYDDLLASIAPRPMMVMAPRHDQAADVQGVKATIGKANAGYGVFDRGTMIDLRTPDDYNRFSDEMRAEIIDWLSQWK